MRTKVIALFRSWNWFLSRILPHIWELPWLFCGTTSSHRRCDSKWWLIRSYSLFLSRILILNYYIYITKKLWIWCYYKYTEDCEIICKFSCSLGICRYLNKWLGSRHIYGALTEDKNIICHISQLSDLQFWQWHMFSWWEFCLEELCYRPREKNCFTCISLESVLLGAVGLLTAALQISSRMSTEWFYGIVLWPCVLSLPYGYYIQLLQIKPSNSFFGIIC